MTVTIFEKSVEGRRAFVAPELDVPRDDDALPERFRRSEPPRLPEIAEPEIVRHYNRLSKRNFDLDTGFYPLGSCTMKHNPKLHEQPVVREFALRLEAPVGRVIELCAADGVNPGYPLEDDGLLIAITEQRSREDIDRLVDVLGAAVAAEREAVTA